MTIRCLIILATTASLVACTSAEPIGANHPPELQRIVRTYERCVDDALKDENSTWVHGWDGNDRIAAGEEAGLKGLCYEWQELVFAAVAQDAARQGWQASMITINEDWFSEHHAVLIHAQSTGAPELVLAERLEAAWVLDPWLDGKAEVFRLGDWLSIPWIVFEGARIETIPAR